MPPGLRENGVQGIADTGKGALSTLRLTRSRRVLYGSLNRICVQLRGATQRGGYWSATGGGSPPPRQGPSSLALLHRQPGAATRVRARRGTGRRQQTRRRSNGSGRAQA